MEQETPTLVRPIMPRVTNWRFDVWPQIAAMRRERPSVVNRYMMDLFDWSQNPTVYDTIPKSPYVYSQELHSEESQANGPSNFQQEELDPGRRETAWRFYQEG